MESTGKKIKGVLVGNPWDPLIKSNPFDRQMQSWRAQKVKGHAQGQAAILIRYKVSQSYNNPCRV